jgi:hypothetical protein
LKKTNWPILKKFQNSEFQANFKKISELFTQKIVTKPSKIWVGDPGSEIRDPRSGIRDPGSEIRDPEKTYSGSRIWVKKAPYPGSGSATLQITCFNILLRYR